jgi:hypothetical protein
VRVLGLRLHLGHSRSRVDRSQGGDCMGREEERREVEV